MNFIFVSLLYISSACPLPSQRGLGQHGITFSRREIALMNACAAIHYDARCRAASIPGPGAFLNGWRNGRIGRPVRVEWQQIDLLLKILEMARHLRFMKDQREAFGLGLTFRRILAELNERAGKSDKMKGWK